MNILIAIKRVIDPYVKIRVNEQQSAVETKNVKMSINPFDEIAVEEAIRLKEKGLVENINLLSIGPEGTQDTLRHALSLGADRAIWVKSDQKHCSLNIAKIIKHIATKEQPQLILMGKQAIDGDNNQTPQMLAALLNWPQATFASKIVVHDDKLEVTREIDGGLETLELKMPCVISTDLRLNEPRYASLPNIMKAKQKPFETIELESLGLKLNHHIETLRVSAPPLREKGIKVDSVKTLLDKLRHEAKVL